MSENQSYQSTILHGGLKRPNWICRGVNQNVILVRDRSGSMTGKPALDASAASLDLVAELAKPENKDGFLIGCVDFAMRAKTTHEVEKATALDGRVKPLDEGSIGGGTNITSGLKRALKLVKAAQTKGDVTLLRPVVLCFSDGGHNVGPGPEKVAQALKQDADLVTVAFGQHADEELLKRLASTHEHFYKCVSGRELRAFLAAVGQTMTATMAAGTNATQALTQVQQ